MRPSPQGKPAPVTRKVPHFEDRKYRFLTYVFGSGVKVRDHEKHLDATTPIRGASIRGQLRFWWRACNPSGCQTLQELRQREGEIWGTTSHAAKVELIVHAQPPLPQSMVVYRYDERHKLVLCSGMKEIAYGAFPLQPSREAQKNNAQPWVLYDYGAASFTLRVKYPPDLREDVEAALWAWETFGGLGGRTRRGFGSISRGDGPGIGGTESELSKYRNNPAIEGIPSLGGARFAASPRTEGSALDAWKTGLHLLQDMRQAPGFGRNPSPKGSRKPAGRSRWPEPDEIRRLTGKSAPIHSHPVVSVQRFPRAAFGMPIVFHFHPGSAEEPGSSGDPKMKRLQLQPVGFERFASPLIIRPMADGKTFRATALVLTSRIPPAELVADDARYQVDWSLNENLAQQIPALNRNRQVYTDPIQLFLEELQK